MLQQNVKLSRRIIQVEEPFKHLQNVVLWSKWDMTDIVHVLLLALNQAISVQVHCEKLDWWREKLKMNALTDQKSPGMLIADISRNPSAIVGYLVEDVNSSSTVHHFQIRT